MVASMQALSGFRFVAMASRLLLPALLLTTGVARGQTTSSATLPDRLADSTFWRMASEFSEPTGTFASENFTSNETNFQLVIPELLRITKPGGVYLGVGPEQNFTYIVALQPKLVFITDIRRQNMMQHLIYKSLMELYPNRADFLSHLFSRPRPAGLDSNSTAAQLFNAYSPLAEDTTLYRKNLNEVLGHLTKKHGFTLSKADSFSIERVIASFSYAGTYLTYGFTLENGWGNGGGNSSVDYTRLMTATDGAGLNRSYLATEANYRWIRELQLRNALVPVVGDFGGTKALKSIADYLRKYNATVTAFYCSNVEQYLFSPNQNTPNGGWTNFYTNVAALPLDSTSTFIRTPGSRGGAYGGAGGTQTTLIASMRDLVTAFKAGQINTHADVLALSRVVR